jgi:hypothetical protein
MRGLGIGFLIGALFWLGLAACAHAKQFGELQELYVDFKNFAVLNDNQRNPVIYPSPPYEGLNFGEHMNLFWGVGYLDAEVESLTDSAQFREVGLNYRMGVHLGHHVDFGLWHLSQHVLDEPNPPGYYPFQTALELKVWLYRK